MLKDLEDFLGYSQLRDVFHILKSVCLVISIFILETMLSINAVGVSYKIDTNRRI